MKSSHTSSHICHEENFTSIFGMLLFRLKGNSGSKDSFTGTERNIFKPYCWHEVTKLKLGITLCELKFFFPLKNKNENLYLRSS